MGKRKFVEAAKGQREAVTIQFDYNDDDAVNLLVEKNEDRQFRPNTPLVYGQPIVFDITPAENFFLDLTRSNFVVEAQITDAAGTAILVANHVGLCNQFAHSAFSDILVELGGKLLNQNTNGMYPYRAYLETLLSADEDAKNSFHQMEGWYKDTPSQIGQADPNAAIDARNVGLFNRKQLFATGSVYQFMLRPHLDIFHQPRAIPSHTHMRITLNPSRNSFLLKTADPGEDAHGVAIPQVQYQFHIRQIVFIADSLAVNKNAVLGLHQSMSTGKNLVYPLRRVDVKQLTITPNQSVHNFERVFNGVMPDRLVLNW